VLSCLQRPRRTIGNKKMSETPQNNNQASDLASQTAGRYGRLALARAAGEAAAAQRKGDRETSALWANVIAVLRSAILQNQGVLA